MIKVELGSGKSWYFENTGDKGTSISTESSSVDWGDVALYDENDNIDEFKFNATYAKYISAGYKEVITNNSEETVNFYLPGFYGFIESHETEEKALIKVELGSGKSWYFENTGDKGTSISTESSSVDWGDVALYDENDNIDEFKFNVTYAKYISAGYKETNY